VAILQARGPENVTFTDVTKESGITFSHAWSPEKKYILESMSGGVAVFDFDQDGLVDLYFVNSPTVETALRPFESLRVAPSTVEWRQVQGGAGDPRSAPSELWRNRGDGTFVDVTDKAGVGHRGCGMCVTAAEFDYDGWDDLYVTCFVPIRLYRY
jgi:hypothetical protein